MTSKAITLPAESSATSLWIEKQSKLAPVRKQFRLMRKDATGEHLVDTVDAKDSEIGRRFDTAIIADAQGQTGYVTYRVQSVGADGNVISQSPVSRVRGAAAINEGDNPAGSFSMAMAVASRDAMTQAGAHQSEAFSQTIELMGQVKELWAEDREEIRNLRDENKALWNRIAQQEVEKARQEVPDPEGEAKALLYEKMAESLGVLPALLMGFLESNKAEGKAIVAGPEDLAAIKSAASQLSDKSIVAGIGTLMKHPDVAKAVVDQFTPEEKLAFGIIIKRIVS